MAPNTATAEQTETLLNFLNEHKDLARGRLRSVEGRVQAKRLWEVLCNTLNSMGGCTKSIKQWQKVWFDRKHLAKKAAADSRRSALATGGGPSTVPPLTPSELMVLSILGDGFGNRQTGARVPAFRESNEPIPSTSSIDSVSISQPQQLMDFSEFDIECLIEPDTDVQNNGDGQPIDESQPIYSTPDDSQVNPQRLFSSTRPRRRADANLRSRLLELEEGRVEREITRNQELAGIRAVLVQIYEVLTLFVVPSTQS